MSNPKPVLYLSVARRTFIGLSAATAGLGLLPGIVTATTDPTAQHTFTEEQAAALFAIAQSLIPLADIPPRVYHDIVSTLEKSAAGDTATKQLIENNLVTARLHFGQPIHQTTAEELTAYLQGIEQGTFFQQVYATTLAVFFAHPDVWQRIGYEGESFSKGGYLQRGFNDLDWLPEPPTSAQGPLPF